MNWMADFNQICIVKTLGMMKSWLGFGDLGHFFKVTAGLKLPNLSQKVLVCIISDEPGGGFHPDLHGYNIWT